MTESGKSTIPPLQPAYYPLGEFPQVGNHWAGRMLATDRHEFAEMTDERVFLTAQAIACCLEQAFSALYNKTLVSIVGIGFG